jgi:hypothetical protein
VAQCDTLLAVIGKGWLHATDERGSRPLDDPDDFVRIEIESALKQGKRVIPVLVNEARMPRPDELPEALRPLAKRNAIRLTHEGFRADLQGLVKALQPEEIAALRGGSWLLDPRLLRAANRVGDPSYIAFNFIGFRVGRTLTP